MNEMAQMLNSLSTMQQDQFRLLKSALEKLSDGELKNLFSNSTVLTAVVQSVRGSRKRAIKNRIPSSLEKNHVRENKSFSDDEEGGSLFNNGDD